MLIMVGLCMFEFVFFLIRILGNSIFLEVTVRFDSKKAGCLFWFGYFPRNRK